MTREEAIKIIESNCSCTGSKLREACAMFIPELAESEDERIRKALIEVFKKKLEKGFEWAEYGIPNRSVLGWLEKQKHLYETTKDRFYREGFEEGQLYEKQKEQKPVEINEEDEKIRKIITDSVFYQYGAGAEYKDALDYLDKLEKQKEEKPAEWSKEDKEHTNSILERLEGMCKKGATFTQTRFAVSEDIDWLRRLHQKKSISYGELPLVSIDYMEGLDTDFEKQVGAVIASAMNREHQFTSKYIKWTAQQLMGSVKDKQNSEEKYVSVNKEWSEKDKVMLNTIIANYKYFSEEFLNQQRKDIGCPSYGARNDFEEEVSWLKSLPERFNLQPKQEWSKEDEYKLNFLTEMLEGLDQREFDTRYMKELSSWLKSLPERFNLQSEQEWSEEDKDTLNAAIHMVEEGDIFFTFEKTKYKVSDWLKLLPERFNLHPKAEWSEEDKKFIKHCAELLDGQGEPMCALRLESLRPQPISQPNTNHTVWHNASEEKPAKLPIIHIWNHGNSVSAVVGHENIGLQAQLGDINFQPDDKWAYVEDLLNVQPHWKPSEEQMRAVFVASERNDKLGSVLSTLYNDLRKHYDLC